MNTGRTFLNALRVGDVKAVDLLIQKGCNPSDLRDADGCSPIHIAVMRDQPFILLDLLLKAGCDINARDLEGKTPLHWACELNFTQQIGHLLDQGARIDVYTHAGNLPQIPALALLGRIHKKIEESKSQKR